MVYPSLGQIKAGQGAARLGPFEIACRHSRRYGFRYKTLEISVAVQSWYQILWPSQIRAHTPMTLRKQQCGAPAHWVDWNHDRIGRYAHLFKHHTGANQALRT